MLLLWLKKVLIDLVYVILQLINPLEWHTNSNYFFWAGQDWAAGSSEVPCVARKG